MWAEIERIRIQTPNLLTEIVLRVILIFIVCVMQAKVKPHVHHITEAELLNYMRPRRDSYVPPMAMVFIIVIVPLVVLSLSYFMTGKHEDTVQSLLAWTLAISINALITETTKLIVGRPRPDFFYRCYPTGVRTLSCDLTMRDVMEGRKSFPSGHSSFAFCSLGYLSIWLCGRLKIFSYNRGETLRIIPCLLPLLLATLIAISRVCDNHHHWEDIVVGSMLGFLCSYFCYRQYYNALDSEESGYAYIVTSGDLFETIDVQESYGDVRKILYDPNLNKVSNIEDNKYS